MQVRPLTDLLDEYRTVQAKAKRVLAQLGDAIGPESSEASIATTAADWLCELGISDTWYYDCPALVLAGDRSCLSLSGRDYVPAVEPLGNNNLVTVDLSPCIGEIWGDCARSFAIENGDFVANPSQPDFRRGLDTQARLHTEMKRFVTPETRINGLFEFANDMIASLGYVNLDFLGNVGHSIEKSREDRVYIDANNKRELDSIPLFTFEPHIREINGNWGFKHENIYFFNENGALVEL